MAILSRSLPGSVRPRIPRKPAHHQHCCFPGRAVLPAQGLARGNPRPPCHSCRGIPAPWACHSGKVVPAPRIQQREGIPAHSGGSEHPCAALRSEELTPSARECWRRAVGRSGEAAAGALQAPDRSQDAQDRAYPRQPANPCGAASPGRRGGGGGTGGGRVGDSYAGTRRAAPESGRARSGSSLRRSTNR